MRPEVITIYGILVLAACILRTSEAVTCLTDPTVTGCIDCTADPSNSQCVPELTGGTINNPSTPWGNSPFPWNKVKRILLMF